MQATVRLFRSVNVEIETLLVCYTNVSCLIGYTVPVVEIFVSTAVRIIMVMAQ